MYPDLYHNNLAITPPKKICFDEGVCIQYCYDSHYVQFCISRVLYGYKCTCLHHLRLPVCTIYQRKHVTVSLAENSSLLSTVLLYGPRNSKKCLPAYANVLIHFISCMRKVSFAETRLYNFDLLKPHFFYSKTGVYRGKHYFYYFAKNIDCGYPLEPPRRGGSNEYPQTMF